MRRDDIPLEPELEDVEDVAPAERDERTPEEKEEDWLYFHLSLAAGCRARMARLTLGSQDFFEEDSRRRQAVLSAMKHYDLLRRMGAAIPPLLDSMMRSEGL